MTKKTYDVQMSCESVPTHMHLFVHVCCLCPQTLRGHDSRDPCWQFWGMNSWCTTLLMFFLGDKSAPVCAFDLMHRLWVWTLRTILLEAADLWIIASETQVSPPVAILNWKVGQFDQKVWCLLCATLRYMVKSKMCAQKCSFREFSRGGNCWK